MADDKIVHRIALEGANEIKVSPEMIEAGRAALPFCVRRFSGIRLNAKI
jgi:hypothetical protein